VLATGRSLSEVRERCSTYRLVSGKTEYCAVIYNRITTTTTSLLGKAEVEDLNRLRIALKLLEGVHLDPDFHYAICAYCLDSHGKRHELTADVVSLALAESRTRSCVREIRGAAQTDFMSVSIDKGTGLRALVARLAVKEAVSRKKTLVCGRRYGVGPADVRTN
jgi:hypothetical protein